MRIIPTLIPWRSVMGTAGVAALVVSAAACGSEDASEAEPDPAGEPVSVVVTTSILGDIVTESLGDLVGEEFTVETIMPIGVSPHGFDASAEQAEAMEQADLLVTNGVNLEEGLTGVIESAEESGTEVFTFADHVEVLPGSGGDDHDHDEAEGEEGHDHDEAEDDHDHDHSAGDPHIWMDPTQMAAGVEALAEELAELSDDPDAVHAEADDYIVELTTLDEDIATTLEVVPAEDRLLVTNHQAFGYFVNRYDFEMLGAAIPSLTTDAAASAAELEELAALIREHDLPAIFSETIESDELVDALAEEVGSDVQVVQLYTGSLGEPGSGADTYAGMMTTNAQRIADALG
ncbi:MAG: metal ABC transporter substrate-binding protein [Microthrixaceae bacterium]|nr:metal ABC transporter substrate-binding protein [Microthrixaceae bacterium]